MRMRWLLALTVAALLVAPMVTSAQDFPRETDPLVTESLKFLKEVFEIDVDSYELANISVGTDGCGFVLRNETTSSRLRVYCYFRDGGLYWADVYIECGVPILKPGASLDDPRDARRLTKLVSEFLRRYKEYFGLKSDVYDKITKALGKLKALDRKLEITEGSLFIEIFADELGVDVYCSIVKNGARTPRLFGLWFPSPTKLPAGKRDRFYAWTSWGFYDKFRFTKFADVEITVTRDEAVSKALQLMKDYYTAHPDELYGEDLSELVNRTESKLVYATRGGELCPAWDVWIYFKRRLPNGVHGFSASIWADTGDVRGSSVMGVYVPTAGEVTILRIDSIILALVVAAVAITVYVLKKNGYKILLKITS